MNEKFEEFLAPDLKSLKHCAESVVASLRGGEIIGLVGDLGAGKTTFVQYMAKAMGIKKPVRSPTFILMQCLETGRSFRKKTGIVEMCHIDAYRMKNEDELFAIGFGEYAEREDCVTVLEWADRIESVSWLEDYREIRFVVDKDQKRHLECRYRK
jgi:tRNA threonylcarbamoyladenosine biosynthesis protein TsaE